MYEIKQSGSQFRLKGGAFGVHSCQVLIRFCNSKRNSVKSVGVIPITLVIIGD
jgi:hypothetical protein